MPEASSTTAGGVDGLLLVAVGVAGGAVLAVTAWLLRRRPVAREQPIRRAPSPSSVGLADDPIVAALASRGEATDRRRRAVLPGEDGPPT